jgi:hypothetical protein
MVVLLAVAYFASSGRPQQVQSAYLCGENLAELSSAEFRGAADQAQTVSLRSYYFEGWLGEGKITRWANPIALALLVALLGVAFL